MKDNFFENYCNYKADSINGRYLTNESILKLNFKNIIEIGKTTNNLPIYYLKLGFGPKKILIWSQMHGNETTSTRALLDVISYFSNNEDLYYKNLTFHIIPILNPDGALSYSRENYKKIDINRDAVSLTQNESIILINLYKKIKPDFCFNLHDQRSIYSVSDTNKPSVLSFLSPAADDLNFETPSRIVSMKIISSIHKNLMPILNGNISRYKDNFNVNCFGDTFQKLKTPTILFESGHFKDDYSRENVRKYMCFALLTAINSILYKTYKKIDYKDYYLIKENDEYFRDILIRNIKVKKDNKSFRTDISIMFNESLDKYSKVINFIPQIFEVGKLSQLNGHSEYDLINSDKIFNLNYDNLNELLNSIK